LSTPAHTQVTQTVGRLSSIHKEFDKRRNIMAVQKKCSECGGSGKTGFIFKSTCRKCGGKGYILLQQKEARLPNIPLSSPSANSELPNLNEIFQQIEQLVLSKQIAQLEKANELLDRLCIPEYTTLSQLCVAQAASQADMNMGESLEILDSAFRMAARGYNDIGKAYGEYAMKYKNNAGTYIPKGTHALQMALHAAASSPGDVDGRANHIKASAHFGLGFFALMQEQNQTAKKHFQECIKLPLLTNPQIQYASAVQTSAKQMLQNL
jgi:hypothetical protein